MNHQIYLDNGSTSFPKPPGVAEAVFEFMTRQGVNINRGTYGKAYSAEEMVGKKVMVVTNLKPATLAGIRSEGMILCAEDADGNLSLMVPEKSMPAGAEIC